MKVPSDRIRKTRRFLDLTGAEVAEKLGISTQYYYNIERGRRNLSAELAIKLADIFNVSLDYLLGKSIYALIEDRLSQLDMSIEELAKLTELPESFLRGLDTLPPAPWDYEPGEMLDRLAKALKMDTKVLTAAYARQEPPGYDGPSLSPEETFAKLQDDFANEKFDEPETITTHHDGLTEEEILTLAAHQVGHEGKLTEEQLSQIKLAMKIALMKNDK
ncbi:helix-turn-helix domain-containing protein [Paenibacillus fonticola]|uniref:helix-turn-helix domain-containing protein n=1 Tax=Paenibacillus fonticola TaxID=379896 RepID=UPI000374DAED|nr:helix-turn-helix transcriptional regulator [Paenibacillus fonticola]